jgi:hypothetical protein
MQMLSDDDGNLKGMTLEELAAAWDLWFDLAQTTNASDQPYTHGVFVGAAKARDGVPGRPPRDSGHQAAHDSSAR